MNIVIFASGNGTNAQRIAEYFKNNRTVNISGIYCNRKDAYVLTRARSMDIPGYLFNRDDFYKSDKVVNKLINGKTDLIVLAGFLWLIPNNILCEFNNRIINIHPALLPDYGGKGMYGAKVHEAVIKAGVKQSGISIHYVNEKYDEGEIIFQAKCNVETDETPDSLAVKIHQLEYEHYPRIIEEVALKNSITDHL